MKMMSTVGGVITLIAASTIGARANDDFKLEYRIERIDAGRLSVGRCTETLRRTAQENSIPVAVSDPRDEAVVISGGPRDGKGAIIAYCIAAGDKTVYVVQGIGYRAGTAATAFADKAHADLLKASQ
ncbi:DUF6180 family protein [Methylobacterium radiodurans]|uniref:Uncharacterized protein n=1 Tax=Methylobacterium radiodurans TaxID=2202828 RepID=A0A2U8VY19_9HYPH|nr:DUF6180 family protein [Methylobacterium radiodurans]AWN38667.1 hypothetical protein DK427_25465 [Methylobacterium radiodurans]